MANLQQLKVQILADGIIQDEDVEVICRELYPDAKFNREQVEFLIALRNEADSVCVTFEQLVFEAVKFHVLIDGCIDAEEAAWLRRMLFADGSIDERKKRLLRDLKNDAGRVSSEFERLYDACLKDAPGAGE